MIEPLPAVEADAQVGPLADDANLVRRVEQLRQKDPQVNLHLEAISQKLAAAE